MRRAALVMIAVLACAAPAAAQDPITDFFRYKPSPAPVAGDCPAAWYGEFSGQRYDTFAETYRPFAARGCFETELACRIWQQQAITHLDRGPLYYTRCRPAG
ncbi:MAG TPA: hypothetical protein VN240_03095 [Propylenella sp.]|nr:hypothetical protein [Propylenella sp.]